MITNKLVILQRDILMIWAWNFNHYLVLIDVPIKLTNNCEIHSSKV